MSAEGPDPLPQPPAALRERGLAAAEDRPVELYFVDVASTHGSLNRNNSVTFIMSGDSTNEW